MAFLATPFVIVKTLKAGIFFSPDGKNADFLQRNTKLTLKKNRFYAERSIFAALHNFFRAFEFLMKTCA
jgi:hypothetical protein